MTVPRDTARLTFRRPTGADVPAIFERYASDAEVTRYLSWPRHRSIADTRSFLRFSDGEWAAWPSGPLLIFSRAQGVLLGSTGLTFESRRRASTGYVLARGEWGKGYATEALGAMVGLATDLGIERLCAVCHVDHHASWRVMEKCGFHREGVRPRYAVFPNLSPDACDVLLYCRNCQP
jgi:RimJ/RimL family protein N-acetyltransferase